MLVIFITKILYNNKPDFTVSSGIELIYFDSLKIVEKQQNCLGFASNQTKICSIT